MLLCRNHEVLRLSTFRIGKIVIQSLVIWPTKLLHAGGWHKFWSAYEHDLHSAMDSNAEDCSLELLVPFKGGKWHGPLTTNSDYHWTSKSEIRFPAVLTCIVPTRPTWMWSPSLVEAYSSFQDNYWRVAVFGEAEKGTLPAKWFQLS